MSRLTELAQAVIEAADEVDEEMSYHGGGYMAELENARKLAEAALTDEQAILDGAVLIMPNPTPTLGRSDDG